MKRALLFVMMLVSTSWAQVTVHDHSHGPPPPPPPPTLQVTGFAPQSGPVGTHVKILGRGFTGDTKILVGGRFVGVDDIQPTYLAFTIPGSYGDGLIVLRQPGAGNDLAVGQFAVVLPAQLVGFQPPSGPAGTRVELQGTGFLPGDQVMFSGMALPALEMAPNRIVIEIPPGAHTDTFTLVRAGASQSSTGRRFLVTLPPPSVSAFSPMEGAPGTQVHIMGTGFSPDDGVFYGDQQLQIVGRAVDGIDVVIPNRARKPQVLTVRGPRGESSTVQPFVPMIDPTLDHFQPMFGAPGTTVDIFGANWRREDSVWFNGQQIQVTFADDGHIQVVIPPNAMSGTFSIQRRGRVVATGTQPFQVTYPPAIVSFNPPGGPAGTRVTITGTAFGPEAKVFFGSERVQIAGRNADQSIDVIIPDDAATDQTFTVATRSGQSTSTTPFQVYVYSTIEGISPASGTIGTHVTILGRHHGHNDKFFLNGIELPVVDRQGGQTVVEIPPGATSGTIEWDTWGHHSRSGFHFDVFLPPSLVGFRPAGGVPGTEVLIDGANFSNSTAVFYGNMACPIVRRNLPSQLVVTIPRQAAGADYLWVEDNGLRTQSTMTFNIIPLLSLTSVTPPVGRVGTQVTLNGTNFTDQTQVFFGQTPVQIIRKQLPVALLVLIPPGPDRPDFFWIQDNGQRVRSQSIFQFTPDPSPQGLAPTEGPPLTNVVISGNHLGAVKAVWFGQIPCQIISRSEQQIVVQIPQNARGRDYLAVDDGTIKVMSQGMFGVAEPRPPGQVIVHDHSH